MAPDIEATISQFDEVSIAPSRVNTLGPCMLYVYGQIRKELKMDLRDPVNSNVIEPGG